MPIRRPSALPPARPGRLAARAAAMAALVLGAAACELTEVTVEEPEEVLVVEGVLRTDARIQRILLHRNVLGSTVQGEPGAQVVVITPSGAEVAFREGGNCYRIDTRYQETDELEFRGTCYESPTEAGRFVAPGQAYELRVTTVGGEVVRGRTTVPGPFVIARVPTTGADVLQGTIRCRLPPFTSLPLEWRRSPGARTYVADMRIHGLRVALQPYGVDDAPDPMELRGLAISEEDTTLVLPTEFGVFDRIRYEQDVLLAIQEGFPEGTTVQLVVAAADRNYVNAVRGGSFNPSGQVRISSVVGDGVGVFGSLVPRHVTIDVTANPVGSTRCG